MAINRRTLLTNTATLLPLVLATGCKATGAPREWPGEATPQGQLPRLPVGMNLAGIADYEPGFPFRNLMWGARPWLTRTGLPGGAWDTGKQSLFEYDADGYPLESPVRDADGTAHHIFTLLPNVLTPGRYVVTYDGEGELDALLGSRVVSKRPGRMVILMGHQPGVGELLVILRSTRGNHIRNIRVLAERDDPSTLAENPFRQDFLDFCAPFHVLRFMDWAVTNGSLQEGWETRKRPTFYTMLGLGGDLDGQYVRPPGPFSRRYGGGVAIEVMIQLANKLQINPWFCIPHRATDDYITQFSRLVRDTLDPRLTAYLEYSNELWNWQFPQAQWMLRSRYAGDELERKGVTAWRSPATKSEGTNHPERIGALICHAFSIWQREWQGQPRNRYKLVCAVQGAWFDASRRTFQWCLDAGLVDALAPAAYFGPDEAIYARWEAKGAALTVDDVIADMSAAISRIEAGDSLLDTAILARSNGKQFITYEGGQHIQPKDQADKPYNRALYLAQSDPRMYDLYVRNLAIHKRLGNSMFCAFSSVSQQGTRYGSWGAKARYDTPNDRAPKYRALIDCNTPRGVTS